MSDNPKIYFNLTNNTRLSINKKGTRTKKGYSFSASIGKEKSKGEWENLYINCIVYDNQAIYEKLFMLVESITNESRAIVLTDYEISLITEKKPSQTNGKIYNTTTGVLVIIKNFTIPAPKEEITSGGMYPKDNKVIQSYSNNDKALEGVDDDIPF